MYEITGKRQCRGVTFMAKSPDSLYCIKVCPDERPDQRQAEMCKPKRSELSIGKINNAVLNHLHKRDDLSNFAAYPVDNGVNWTVSAIIPHRLKSLNKLEHCFLNATISGRNQLSLGRI